jgi:hypothetical protein
MKINHNNIIKNILSQLTPEQFKEATNNTYIEELQPRHFNKKNLFNSNYNDLDTGDYERFYHLCNLYGENNPKEILMETLSEEYFLPSIIKGKNEIYYLLSGNLEMCAKKVLNILPVIKILPVNFNLQIF